jgi:signal transduction histidine kinase
VAPHLQNLTNTQLPYEHAVALKQLLTNTPLGQQIVSFKIWSPDGTIIYSPSPDLLNRQFPPSDGLETALAGEIHTELSNLDEPEQAHERQFGDSLIETYAPIHDIQSGEIIAVSEFYQRPDSLQAEIRASQYQSWFIMAVVLFGIYVVMAGIVSRANQTIVVQQNRLQETVTQLNTLLAQNAFLHERMRRAAARTTTLNEQYLRRISADLHDGPAQDLALALLRVDLLEQPLNQAAPEAVHDFRIVRDAIQSALHELRTISAGLRLPEIEDSSPAEIMRRAVRDYEHKTQCPVKMTLEDLPTDIPCSVKMTLFRVLKETLNNGYYHAGGKEQTVMAFSQEGYLTIQVSDKGPGFDKTAVQTKGHLGLAGMQERVEVLGGQFDIQSTPGQGTTVQIALPISFTETIYE